MLAINIGNTNISVAYFHNNQMYVKRYNYKEISEDRLISLLKADISSKNDHAKNSILSSVVPKLTPVVSSVILEATGKVPILVDKNTKFPIDFSAYDASLLGVDRLLCCVSALEKYKAPAIIFDLGTAITVNVINNKGAFIGGAILPGVEMGLNALTKGTALLPKGKIIKPSVVIGNDTATCLTSGAIYGNASIIEGMSLKVEKELGYKCTVIVTGGNALDIIPFCNTELIHEQNLLLEGLIIMLRGTK